MATRNLWKTTEVIPLLRSRGNNLSTALAPSSATAYAQCVAHKGSDVGTQNE